MKINLYELDIKGNLSKDIKRICNKWSFEYSCSSIT